MLRIFVQKAGRILAVLLVLTGSLAADVKLLDSRTQLPVPGDQKHYAEGYYFYLFDGQGTVFQGYININNYYPFSDLDSVVEYWIHKDGKILFKGHHEFEDDDLHIRRAEKELVIGSFRVQMKDKLLMTWKSKNETGQIELAPSAPGFRFDPPLIDDPAWLLSYPYPWGKVRVRLVADGVRYDFDGYGAFSHYRSTKKLTKMFLTWQNMFLGNGRGEGLFVTRMLNDKKQVASGAVSFDGEGNLEVIAGSIEPGRRQKHKKSGHVVPDVWQVKTPLGGCSIDTTQNTVALSPLDEAGFFLRKIAKIMFGNPWSWDSEATCAFASAATAETTEPATNSTTWQGVMANDILK